MWSYQEQPNSKTPITCIQICLYSHKAITKYGIKGNRNSTEVWWGLCTQSFWGETGRPLQMVRLKNCKIQTGTHKTRDFLCCTWLPARFKVNMIPKSHWLHRDFSDKVSTVTTLRLESLSYIPPWLFTQNTINSSSTLCYCLQISQTNCFWYQQEIFRPSGMRKSHKMFS